MSWCPPPWSPGAPTEFDTLAALLDDVRFKAGWMFRLMTFGSETMLAVDLECVDTYTGQPTVVGHRIPVPVAVWPRHVWRRWLLDRIVMVETHEACEWFQEGGVRPFDPHHDPMQHAYRVIDWTAPYTTDVGAFATIMEAP